MHEDGSAVEKWKASASAWIRTQGQDGDWARRAILDPALASIFADVEGQRILDVGCGEGRYSRILASQGAQVTGIDPVPAFIQRAESLDSKSRYLVASAESMPLDGEVFDRTLCYLTLIDIENLEMASQEIARTLKPNGELVIVSISNMASSTPNWTKDWKGKKLYRKVDRYMEEFPMDLEWKGIRITNYHRPLSYTLGLFHHRNFVTTQLLEPLPPVDDPQYEYEHRCPNFQIFVLRKESH